MNRWLKMSFTIILIIIGIVLYARFIGTMGFKTKEYTIYNDSIPSGFDGIKIVHFSDLHYNRAITSSVDKGEYNNNDKIMVSELCKKVEKGKEKHIQDIYNDFIEKTKYTKYHESICAEPELNKTFVDVNKHSKKM